MKLFNSITIIYAINICMAMIVIFLERKDPTATLAWVLVLLVFPGAGFLLYLLLSQNFSRKQLFIMKIHAKKSFGDYIRVQRELFETGRLIFNDKNVENYKDLIKMNLFYHGFSYTQNNEVEIYTDGQKKFEDLFKAIEGAKNHIHMEYYILRNDSTGKNLFDLLSQKAKEGVEVRLLYDSVGGRHISKEQIEMLRRSGVKVAVFFGSTFPFFNFKINYRNHRKIVVIDGITGFEATVNSELKEYKKTTDAASYPLAIALLKESDIDLTALFMVQPDYGLKDFNTLRKFIKSNKIDVYTLSIMTPLKKTKLYEEKEDLLIDKRPERYDFLHLVLRPKLPKFIFYALFYGLHIRLLSSKRVRGFLFNRSR
jgi:hypothetical protein